MSEQQPRRTQPGVHVDGHDRWWHGPNQIVNPDVLAYFKQNLRRDPAGTFYIVNRFGDLLEHAYLDRVSGFPLIIETLLVSPARTPDGDLELILELRLDSRESLKVPAHTLTIYDEHTMALVLPDRGVPARLGPLAMGSLAARLEERPESPSGAAISPGTNENAIAYQLTGPDGEAPVLLPRGKREELFSAESTHGSDRQ